MLTTARKIEIAEAVMNDPRLGTFENTTFWAICDICYELLGKKENEDFRSCIRGMFVFAQNIGIDVKLYWFPLKTSKARTERIAFLKKYIEYLKQQKCTQI